MTSIPRDTFVTLPSYGAKDKLTHAGLYGVNESIRSIENLLDIDIHFYAKFNFSSVVQIVNALGGVNANSIYSFTTSSGYSFSKGSNYMDGNKALAFVRERYSLPGGDFDRVKNQQALVQAVLEKVLSPSILANYTSFLNSISGSFEMNMPSNQLQDLIKSQLSSPKSFTFESIQVEGSGSSSSSTYSIPGRSVYIMIPSDSSVSSVSSKIKSVMN